MNDAVLVVFTVIRACLVAPNLLSHLLDLLTFVLSWFLYAGLSMSAEQVRECMSEYDVDNGT
jgi:hypothetical protein